LRKDENRAHAHNLLGFILGQQGELTSALVHLQRAVTRQPDLADAHYNFRRRPLVQRLENQAISELQEAVRLDQPPAPAMPSRNRSARHQSTERRPIRPATRDRPPSLLAPPYTSTSEFSSFAPTILDRAIGQFEAGLNIPAPSGSAPDWDTAAAGIREALAAKAPTAPTPTTCSACFSDARVADSNEVLAEFRWAARLRPEFAEAHNNIA